MMIQKQITEKIKEFNTIIIFRHEMPDPDALGSQGGLQKAIQHSFPKKNVFVVGEEEDKLKFMNTMDNVPDKEFEDALIIVMDTAIKNRISDHRFNQGQYLIKIDHHPETEPFGDLNWVDTSFSSASEMVCDLIANSPESLGYLQMLQDYYSAVLWEIPDDSSTQIRQSKRFYMQVSY
ncbi:DHH family phosphoesterase (plasmid) [Rossellomorea sp. AcN35-11]|nr:DHH family phosphoesterase [Rossellomorea sp. AcN35-11]